MILGVIPARGGSKGLAGKHTKLLCGKPVIGYTIEAAKRATMLDRIVVSTEDAGIAEASRRFGVEVINRPQELSTDEANIDGALKHAVTAIEKIGVQTKIIVWLQANVPIREKGIIDAVVEKLINSDADSVMTVSEVGWPLEKASKIVGGYIENYWGVSPKGPRRQDYQNAYISNGAVYAMHRDVLMRDQGPDEPYDYFLGKKILPYILSQFEQGIEIDYPDEFLLCEMFLQRKAQERIVEKVR